MVEVTHPRGGHPDDRRGRRGARRGHAGLDDGGEAMTLKALHRVTLPSDGAPHRVPLFQFIAPATSELVGAPEHSPLVHRVARFENTRALGAAGGAGGSGAHQRLRGPGAAHLRGRGRAGEAGLRQRGRAASRARWRRSWTPTGSRAARRDELVKLFLSNTGSRPGAVAIEERMPVSEVEAVEVELLKDKAKPAPAKVSQDGIIRFELPAPARSQQELSFSYTVSSSTKVAGL